MQNLSKFLKVPESNKKGPRNEREYYIEEIRKNLNLAREGTKYKPLPYVAVMLKVKHLSDFDLKRHYYECNKARNFSEAFFGGLKLK